MDSSLLDAFVIDPLTGVLSTGNHTWDFETNASFTVWIQTRYVSFNVSQRHFGLVYLMSKNKLAVLPYYMRSITGTQI